MTRLTSASISLGLCLSADPSGGEERDRARIPERLKWDLSDVYASLEEWDRAKARLVGAIPSLEKYRGRLGESASTLRECLALESDLTKEQRRLGMYAGSLSDEDTRDSTNLARVQTISQIETELRTATSFIEPEILALPAGRVEAWLREDRGLAPWAFFLRDLERRKAHTLSEPEERLVAAAGLMANAADTIHRVFTNADFPWAEVTLSDGRRVKLDAAAFPLHRASAVREDRRLVMETYLRRLGDYRRTLGAALDADVRVGMFYTRARKYGSNLERSLDANDVPLTVYHALIENVRASFPTFRRYLALRKRILGVETLHYHDVYAPLVKEVELQYEPDAARDLAVASFAPLGEEYVRVVRRSFEERWIDLLPSDGKRSGAYSNGSAYDVHPYVLMNYNGRYQDVSTLAHELGHAMHSHLSNAAQPYPTARYPIFLAEVASTFNEALLLDHVLSAVKDDATRLSLLGNWLESVRGTLFRQTQFAEFELRAHEKAEKGETLTGDALDDLYLGILRAYYGHAEGSCVVDDYVRHEWAYIPHFYSPFYVYQYATSFTASEALAERVLSGDVEARRRYLEFLSAGGSDYPIPLLRKAGVDMTTREPFDLTMRRMTRVMDEIERILDRMGK